MPNLRPFSQNYTNGQTQDFKKVMHFIMHNDTLDDSIAWKTSEVLLSLNGVGLWYILPQIVRGFVSLKIRTDSPLVDTLFFDLGQSGDNFVKYRDLYNFCSKDERIALGYYFLYLCNELAELESDKQNIKNLSSFFFFNVSNCDAIVPE